VFGLLVRVSRAGFFKRIRESPDVHDDIVVLVGPVMGLGRVIDEVGVSQT
jgi:hypothetical protein